MKPHTDRNGNPLAKFDRVLIDDELHASVVTAGAGKSLLSHRRSDGEAGEERDWYANERLTLFTADMEADLRQQQEIEALQRADTAAEAHSQEQLNASYR